MRAAAVLVLVGCGRLGFDGGGSAGDAAAPGDTPGDLGGDGPATDTMLADSCAAHAAAMFCDGFEGNLGAWTIQAGVPRTVNAPVHGGTGALEAAIQAQPDEVIVERLLPGATGVGQLYLRAWVYLPSSFTYDEVNLLNFYGSNAQGMSIYLFGGNLSFYRDTGTIGSADGPPFPLDAWHCLELAVMVADVGGSVTLYLDGQSALGEANVDTRPAGGISELNAGIPYTGPPQSGPATVYLDDIVVDVTPIGCAP